MKNRNIALLILFVLLISAFTGCGNSKKVEALIQEAEDYVSNEKYEYAINVYEEIIGYKNEAQYKNRLLEIQELYTLANMKGHIEGKVTWKYNDFVGHRGDNGAVAVLIEKNILKADEMRSMEDLVFISSKDVENFHKKYSYFTFTTKTNVDGEYRFKDIPLGKYILIIKSNNVTGASKKELDKTYTTAFEWYVRQLIEKEDSSIAPMLYQYEIFEIDIKDDDIIIIDHDFGTKSF